MGSNTAKEEEIGGHNQQGGEEEGGPADGQADTVSTSRLQGVRVVSR